MSTTTRPPERSDPEQQAREFAEQLSGALIEKSGVDYGTEFARRYPLMADVTAAIEEVATVMRWANSVGGPVYCLIDEGNPIPIVDAVQAVRFWAIGNSRSYGEMGRYYQRLFGEDSRGNRVDAIRPDEVPAFILRPLIQFLTVRFRWILENPEFRSLGAAVSSQANNPYLPFVVVTQTSGLRIHYSKSFAINFNTVFGAPSSTTPLKGWILPGIHKFAGMDNRLRFHYDPGTFPTPPIFRADLMI